MVVGLSAFLKKEMDMTQYRHVSVGGIKVFYREDGPAMPASGG